MDEQRREAMGPAWSIIADNGSALSAPRGQSMCMDRDVELGGPENWVYVHEEEWEMVQLSEDEWEKL